LQLTADSTGDDLALLHMPGAAGCDRDQRYGQSQISFDLCGGTFNKPSTEQVLADVVKQ
jgi:hypothetical protein